MEGEQAASISPHQAALKSPVKKKKKKTECGSFHLALSGDALKASTPAAAPLPSPRQRF